MKDESKLIREQFPRSQNREHSVPLYLTSSFVFDDAEQCRAVFANEEEGIIYSRYSNPNTSEFVDKICKMEGAESGYAFATGMSAVFSTFGALLKSGDHIVSARSIFGSTHALFMNYFPKWNITTSYFDVNKPETIESFITPSTKIIYAESPTNPSIDIIDLELLGDVAKKHNLILIIDNCFATPYLQNPLDLGADIVMHSVTKYLGGHSDVVMGALVVSDDAIATEMYRIQNSSGAITAPMDCFLVLRGIKTLPLRMKAHCENGEKIAHFLAKHPKVDRVYWPGFETHPNHAVAKRQMRGFGGMLSFNLKGNQLEDALAVVKNVRIFALAESLGGVESLIGHPATMTHAAIPKEEREKTGVVDTLIRLSVGIEDVDDLIDDLAQALK